MSASWDPPVDDILGGVFTRLNPASVLEACRDQLPEDDHAGGRAWCDTRVVEALYHPRRYVRVAYALLPETSVPTRRLWPETDIVYLHAPVRKPMSRRGTILTIGDVEFEAYRFPNDRRLRGLRKFAGSETAVRAWQGWLDGGAGRLENRSQGGVPCDIDPTTLQRLLVRYVPEHKWIVRLRAETTERGSGARRKRRIAVRCASPKSCSTLLAHHSALARAAREGNAAFDVPGVVGDNVNQGILAIEWNRGQSLIEVLDEGSSQAVMEDMAGALSSLHSTVVGDLDLFLPSDVTSSARGAVDSLSLACPDLSARMQSLVHELEVRLAGVNGVCPVTLHNDLHFGQIRIKRGRFALLDLERMALGDPLIDVANFATQLRMLGHRDEYGVDAGTAGRWADEFLEQWSRQALEPMNAERFRCYAVWSLLCLAHGMMRHLRAGWRPLVYRCIESAEAAITSAGQGAAIR